MSKIATLRLSGEKSCYVDPSETVQIRGDKRLLEKLKAGHHDALKMKGRESLKK